MFRYDSKSVFSRWPETVKLCLLVLASVLALLLRDFSLQLLLFLPLFALLIASGYRETRRLFLALAPFLALTDISFWLFLPNQSINLLGLIAVSNARFVNIFMAIAFFIHTTNLFSLMRLMKRAKLPEFIYLPAYVVLRFLPETEKDLREIIAIQKIRGETARRPLRYFKSIFVPLVLTVFERADQVAIAYYLRKKRDAKN
ncbi:MAG: energy-coupling factor transporter transmembrane component T [Candidatus Diapherotrites archaeon]|nr:energy-coupling factor transporter transmembrane component T [Candidatus Diapherotrites archaeon]